MTLFPTRDQRSRRNSRRTHPVCTEPHPTLHRAAYHRPGSIARSAMARARSEPRLNLLRATRQQIARRRRRTVSTLPSRNLLCVSPSRRHPRRQTKVACRLPRPRKIVPRRVRMMFRTQVPPLQRMPARTLSVRIQDRRLRQPARLPRSRRSRLRPLLTAAARSLRRPVPSRTPVLLMDKRLRCLPTGAASTVPPGINQLPRSVRRQRPSR